MKKLFVSLFLVAAASTSLMAMQDFYNSADEIPSVQQSDGWKRIPNVAQYGQSDWNNVIGKAEQVTLEKAKEIANSNPDITYFFHVKGGRMVLIDKRTPENIYRVFFHGDAVFFTGEPWWGSAKNLADGYIKE